MKISCLNKYNNNYNLKFIYTFIYYLISNNEILHYNEQSMKRISIEVNLSTITIRKSITKLEKEKLITIDKNKLIIIQEINTKSNLIHEEESIKIEKNTRDNFNSKDLKEKNNRSDMKANGVTQDVEDNFIKYINNEPDENGYKPLDKPLDITFSKWVNSQFIHFRKAGFNINDVLECWRINTYKYFKFDGDMTITKMNDFLQFKENDSFKDNKISEAKEKKDKEQLQFYEDLIKGKVHNHRIYIKLINNKNYQKLNELMDEAEELIECDEVYKYEWRNK